MKLSSFFLFSVLSLAAPALSAPRHKDNKPQPPKTTFLFSANITLSPFTLIGNTGFGERVVVGVSDGAFKGPKLAGKITGGLVTSLEHGDVHRADATYLLQTNDGTNIMVIEHAVIPYIEVLFEVAADSKYAWLNSVTAWATGDESDEGELSLNFWELAPRE
ncbi:hypothetical protein AJ80_09604 [Polytolypa hystricis UAMH7299]|uniref:Uncharacterized protein n=1 Tax=Polytolypa hystricis (strain UAMH7299) TaxID=1447883 RepID=A0A2B7WMY5_POLH7|nr:hypothetical protein AJ80_09604 [Polytolypa hystricis UAMH7299]